MLDQTVLSEEAVHFAKLHLSNKSITVKQKADPSVQYYNS